jgi:two-component system, NarL family, sensor histidine kinase DesK
MQDTSLDETPPVPLARRVRRVLAPDRPYLWLVYLLLYPLPWFQRPPSGVALAASAIGIALFLAAYLIPARLPGAARHLWQVVLFTAIGFALSRSGGIWSVFPVYAAAAAGQLRPSRRAWRTLLVLAATVALFGVLTLSLMEWLPALLLVCMIGLACCFQTELVAKNAALQRAQQDVRALAVAAERERIARDLHDVLGHTLTLVSVKADLAAKLAARDPSRAQQEMEDVRDAARDALAQIRQAVTGMHRPALAAELAAARRTLAAADVAFLAEADALPLPAALDATAAMILREAVTNVVRHASAASCRVAVRRTGNGDIQMSIEDDGRGGVAQEGNGLAGMRARVAAAGGTLTIAPANATGTGTRLTIRFSPAAGIEETT